MSTVDDRVVSASFETSKFQQGVSTVLSGINRLKQALHFPNAGKGLDQVNQSASKINLSHISNAIDEIKNRFTAMKVVALQVLAGIASQAVAAGGRFVKSFTFGPVMDGLHEYETNLNSVQTILANTQASGAKLKDVNAALQDLNNYSDKTIYNFSEMARNIGTFTAAGVDLDLATQSIKGISNLAALSGSNAEQASTAMYQLSQAISSGKVGLQDWNSVVNAGMGGTVFQRALATTATKMGTLSEGAVQLKGKMKNVTIEGNSFRDSIAAKPGEKSWLTSDVLTKTLKQFTGDMTDAELKAEGFSAAQIKAIQATAKTAFKAATEVKTLSGVLDVAKESAGSGWAQTWQIIFGDFGEAKELFTGVSVAISGFISASAAARNKVLGDWKELGGRTILLRSIKIVFNDIVKVVGAVKKAFRDVFPPTTGKDLFNATKAFREFIKFLTPGIETLTKIRRTFDGLFAILSIGQQVVAGIFHFIGNLFDLIPQGDKGFLDITASIGYWLLTLDKSLKKGDQINKFFDKLTGYIAKPIAVLQKLQSKISDFFDSFLQADPTILGKGLGDMAGQLSPMEKVLKVVNTAWDKFLETLHSIQAELKPVIDSIGEAFASLGTAISETFRGGNFGDVMDALKVGLLGGILVTIRNFFKKDLGESFFGSVTGSFTDAMDALTGRMQAMQQNIKADTLMKIAIAIGILTASVVALSLINEKELNKALSAMAIGFGQLLGAMAILSSVSKSAGFIKVPFIAGAMILLATAIGILTIAVKNLSSLSWEELAKGLGGVAGLLIAISAAAGPLSKNSAGMVRAGVGILAIAVAMKVLASAVKDFGSMSWTEIGKGLAATAVALGAIGLASKLFPAGMIQIGLGLIGIAVGLKLLSGAIKTIGDMDMSTLIKGIGAIAISLGIIVAAMILMPPNLPATAAGLLLVSVALKVIASAIGDFGGMSIGELAKGLGALAASMIILGLALYGMTGSLPGALALGVAAASLMLIVPALERLGKMSWGSILKGLVGLAASLAVLGIAAELLLPVAPALLAMGAALLLIGGGLALAGLGIAAIGVGLSAIAVAGPAAVLVLLKALEQIVTAIPRFVLGVVMGLLQIIEKVAEVAPKFVAAFVKILSTLLDAVIIVAPKLAVAIIVLVNNIIKVLLDSVPKLIDAGLKLLTALLTGIKNNISKVTSMVIDIVTKFLKTLTSKLPQLTKAGADFLAGMLKGIANNIKKVVTAAADVVKGFLKGVGDNISKVATAAGDLVVKFLGGVAKYYTRVVTGGADMIVKLLSGIASKAQAVVDKAISIAGKFVNGVAKGLAKLADEGAKAIINFLNRLADVIRNRGPQLRAAGVNVADAIIDGFLGGLNARDILSAVVKKFKGVIDAAKHAAGAHSPSVFMIELGKNVMEGFAIGIGSNTDAEKAMVAMSQGVINATKSVFQIESPSKVMQDLGEFVGEGFAEGLMGSKDDIQNAFDSMEQQLSSAMQSAKDTLETERDKLRQLNKAKKKDKDAIKETTDAIREANNVLILTKAAHAELVNNLKDEAKALKGVSKQYEDITAQLEEAKQKLEDATKARDDAQAGFAGDFGALPDIDMGTADDPNKDPLGTFIAGLQDRTNAVASYSATLDQLRALGLDDKLYQKLLTDGTADQAFASQLLAGGKTAVQGLNALDAQLQGVSGTLAYRASQNLYQAGVDSAQGLVNGLKSKQSELYKAMEALAESMIKAIKKKLKMKSPSQVFAEMGELSMEGMVNGLVGSTKAVTDAAVGVADEAIKAMNQTFADAAMGYIDVDPTITPVLNLTQVQKDAATMADMLNVVPINAAASYGQASAISAGQNTVQSGMDAVPVAGTVMQFEQNNYSPKALSETEIFRNTKNQLSQAKAALP